MPKTTLFSNDLAALIFNATAIANIADNAASAPLSNLYLSLHTADPGAAGDQTTHETAYTNYTRIAVARTSFEWTVSGGVAENVSLAQFPTCGVTGATITHVAIGTAVSGTGKILYSGPLASPLVVSLGIQPQFAAGDLTTEES